VVIFSSKIIPGNEKGIFALQNALADDGVEIITEKMRPIHVSGHPCRGELEQLLSLFTAKDGICSNMPSSQKHSALNTP